MKLVFRRPELTCTGIESELALDRGDIERLTTFYDGTIEIETAKGLTETQKTKLQALFGLIEKTV